MFFTFTGTHHILIPRNIGILVITWVEIIPMFLLVFCFRYELLRRKIQQPLASNPPEDLNLWHNIYSGTQRFYEDKGLSRWDYETMKTSASIELGACWIVQSTIASSLCAHIISDAVKRVWSLSAPLVIRPKQSACFTFAVLKWAFWARTWGC